MPLLRLGAGALFDGANPRDSSVEGDSRAVIREKISLSLCI